MTKKVDFAGQTWDAPYWAKFITQDAGNGAVIAWEKMPERFNNGRWRCATRDWLDPGKSAVLGHAQVQPLINAI